MSIRFAAPPAACRVRLSKQQARAACWLPANDNRSERGADRGGDAMVDAALRHFAAHGLAAAHHARQQAEQAFFAGDRQAYGWWLEVCRTLDRRMAAGVERNTPSAG